jgi:phenylalanyl-tRNA synthetase beta chain
LKVSLEWLREYVDAGAPGALADALTMSGIEVEAVEATKDGDTVFEVEITPNRPDCLSHWGVARDLSALTGEKKRFPKIEIPEPADDAISADIVEIEEKELCPRYTARIIRGVEVAESPDWMKRRLEAVGLRPINNIVDATNYVLMELGHPLHAFDLDLLDERRIVVRKAKRGEKITTLDDVERELSENDLAICDATKPVALAGVIGGADTAVSTSTTNILLESAVFAPSNIRATARNHKISTDSSFRFERGSDFEMAPLASDRAAALILEIAGGKLASKLIDASSAPARRKKVQCRFDKIRSILGAEVADGKITAIFEALGLSVNPVSDGVIEISPPSFRLDLEREADLAEEVARIHGLDAIPAAPVAAISGGPAENDAKIDIETLTAELLALGLDETMNYSLISAEKAIIDARYAENNLKILDNPLSLDLAALRPSLLPQILETVERNAARGNRDLRIFEIGRVFNADTKKEERLECAIAITGRRHPERFSNEKNEIIDYFDLKGIIEEWMDKRHLNAEFSLMKKNDPAYANYAPGTAAALFAGKKRLGSCGQAHKRLVKGIRTQTPLFIAAIDLDAILALPRSEKKFAPIPQYPSTTRDVAFVADSSLKHSDIIEAIKSFNLPNLETVEIFDLFEDDKSFGPGKKSLAYSLVFRNPERTLTDEEVNSAYEELRKRLPSTLNVTLR